MRKHIICFVAVLMCVISISCDTKRAETPPSISDAVKVIQEYTNSFEGLTIEDAKKKVAPASFSEEPWEDEEIIDGKMITVEYKRYTLFLMCHDGSIVTASVHFYTPE